MTWILTHKQYRPVVLKLLLKLVEQLLPPVEHNQVHSLVLNLARNQDPSQELNLDRSQDRSQGLSQDRSQDLSLVHSQGLSLGRNQVPKVERRPEEKMVFVVTT